jgi:hypothetical protein
MAIFDSKLIPRRVAAGLCAGAVAITLNVIALWSADLFDVRTAHGGLLKLLAEILGATWSQSAGAGLAFHVFIGLAMAVFYSVLLEPLWPWRSWLLGLAYATAVWLTNAFLVLPLIGQGVAGSENLTAVGIIWFAAAHTIFFIGLSLLYPSIRLAISARTLTSAQPAIRSQDI